VRVMCWIAFGDDEKLLAGLLRPGVAQGCAGATTPD